MSDTVRPVDKHTSDHIEREDTEGGHLNRRPHPDFPMVNRTLASPSPLGLLSFATSIFLISIMGLHTRSITTPNILIGVLMFFGGVCQFIAGVIEFISGNTFGATLFPSYAAFNFSYAMIYLPGTGIMAAYTDPNTGAIRAEFDQALAMYLLAWFILTVIFSIGAMRTSWVLFLDLVVLSVCLLLLACGNMVGSAAVLKAGDSLGLVVAFLTYWAGTAGLWAGNTTPINIPTFGMYKGDQAV